VKDDIDFLDLHEIVQVVMGWEDVHLHQFVVGRDERIGNPKMLEDDSVLDESRLPVKKFFNEPKKKIMYVYDFGDDWEHDIVLEKILEPEKGATYPRCIKGENACPPEDIGGPWGFMDVMGKLKAGTLDEEYLEWLGEDYEPTYFSPVEINEMFA
jgi:hypothetical protein